VYIPGGSLVSALVHILRNVAAGCILITCLANILINVTACCKLAAGLIGCLGYIAGTDSYLLCSLV
jgi:hypothetical protein